MDMRVDTTVESCALELVRDGAVVGLGTGRAARAFVHALGARVRAGLRCTGIPTSNATAQLARQEGIPLADPSEVPGLDLAVDGADEVDPNLDLLKGAGGALLREKIVLVAAARRIILVGPEKLVALLGTRSPLPVEVAPFGHALTARALERLGYPSTLRRVPDGSPYVTDNGHLILDCEVAGLPEPALADRHIRSVAGVVETGLFLGLADTVFVQVESGVEVRRRPVQALPGRPS
jgi:ribose 5-phosphate isomerase A